MSAEGLLAHCAFLPLPRLIQNAHSFLHSLPLLQRQSALPPPGQLEYYDVAWGLHKVHLKGKGLAAVSRLSRRCLQVRNLKDSVSDIQLCHNCLSVPWPHAVHVHELHTKCHINAFIV
jgi:hypothetical protein